jgi:hypothetical protein
MAFAQTGSGDRDTVYPRTFFATFYSNTLLSAIRGSYDFSLLLADLAVPYKTKGLKKSLLEHS